MKFGWKLISFGKCSHKWDNASNRAFLKMLWNFWKFLYHLKNSISYSFSDKVSGMFCWIDFFTATKSNLVLYVFISGQIVTVGNGMSDIDTFFSANLIVIGFLFHSIHIVSIDTTQKHTDNPRANTHQILFGIFEIILKLNFEMVFLIPFTPMLSALGYVSNTMNANATEIHR